MERLFFSVSFLLFVACFTFIIRNYFYYILFYIFKWALELDRCRFSSRPFHLPSIPFLANHLAWLSLESSAVEWKSESLSFRVGRGLEPMCIKHLTQRLA